jgi:hypothetical protein
LNLYAFCLNNGVNQWDYLGNTVIVYADGGANTQGTPNASWGHSTLAAANATGMVQDGMVAFLQDLQAAAVVKHDNATIQQAQGALDSGRSVTLTDANGHSQAFQPGDTIKTGADSNGNTGVYGMAPPAVTNNGGYGRPDGLDGFLLKHGLVTDNRGAIADALGRFQGAQDVGNVTAMIKYGVQYLAAKAAGDFPFSPVVNLAVTSGLGSFGAAETTTLYRAVGPTELADINATRALQNLGSAEGKYFTTSASDASVYAKQAVTRFGDPPYTIITTEVPNSSFQGLSPATVDRGIPAWVIPNNRLPGLVPLVQPSMPIPPPKF